MRRCAVAILIAVSSSAARADDPAPTDAVPPPAPPVAAPMPPPRSPPPEVVPDAPYPFAWHPFGYLRMQYIAVQNDPNVAFVGRNDGFEIQNARIGAQGVIGPRVSFVLSFDGAVDERNQVNEVQGNLAVGLRDAFVNVKIADSIYVRGGYFQTLVDPQALIPDTARELVDLPIESRGVRATEGYQTPGLPPGRSQGVALRREPGEPETGVALGFELAAQNGADEFSSNNDNDSLALSASVLARFPHGWLVASGRYNPRTVGDLPFRQDEDDLQGSLGASVTAGPVSVGAGGVVQRTTFPTTGGPDQNAYGAHAQLFVRLAAWPFPAWVGYRFGVLDPSSLVLTDRVIEHTVGAVVAVPRYRMRFQVQLVHVVEQATRDLSNDRAQIAAELSL